MRRAVGLATIGVTLLLVGVVSACTGSGDDAASQSTVAIRPTNYVTLPVVTARPTTTPPGQSAPAGDTGPLTEGEVYTVRSGDALPLIADRYNITVEELADYNDWPEGARHPIYPGDEVRIPPFAAAPSTTADLAGDEPNDDGLGTVPEPDPNAAPRCPDGSERETYEVRSGDFQSRVADRLDLTLDELAAANEGNPIWRTFIPGEELWLPCDGDSLAADEATG